MIYLLCKGVNGVCRVLGARTHCPSQTPISRGTDNREDRRNPHNSKTSRSLAIVKVNTCVGEALLAEISKEISAHAAVCTEV